MSLLQLFFNYFWPTQPNQPIQTESIETQTETIDSQTESIETQTETIDAQPELQTIETQTETVETRTTETRTDAHTMSEVSFEDDTSHSNKKYVYICTVTLANIPYESYEDNMFVISDETYHSPDFQAKFDHMFFRYLVCNDHNVSQIIKDICALYNSDLEKYRHLKNLIDKNDYNFIGYMSECNSSNEEGSIFEEMYSDILDEYYRLVGSFDEMKKYFLDDDDVPFEELYPTSIKKIRSI